MAAGSTASSSAAASNEARPSSGSATPAGAADSAGPTRNRSAKACINCSVKKRRCDGGQPECSVCAGLGITCSYNNNPLRRGPPKGFRSDPETSAKAKLVRKLETTIRDLVAQMGKESAAREIYRISMERGIDEIDMDYAKAEVGTSHHEGSDAESGRSPKRLRTEPPRHPLQAGATGSGPRHPHRGHEADQDSAAGTPHSQYAQLDPAPSQSPYGYSTAHNASAARSGFSAYPIQPHAHPQLAHIAHEAAVFRRAPPTGQYRGSSSGSYPPVKSQEEDDDFLGFNERGDLMHRGSSSGIGLLNRTHTQIQQHGGALSSMGPNLSLGVGASPESDRATGSPGARVYLPPISTMQGGHHVAAPSPLGMAGTVPLPLANPLPAHSSHAPQMLQHVAPPYSHQASGQYAPPQAMGLHSASTFNQPHSYPHTHMSALMHSQSARSSPSPYDDQRGRAVHKAPARIGTRPASTDPIGSGQSPDGHRQHNYSDRDSSHWAEDRSHRRLKDEHRMSSISPARSADNTRPNSPRQTRRGSSSDTDMHENRDHAQKEEPIPPATHISQKALPRMLLTPQQKRLLFKYYYSDFHPFWPVLFKPALDAIPVDELPERLDEVLLYAIWTMASAVMPTTSSDMPAHEVEAEQSAVVQLRSLAPEFYACAEAHLFAGRLRPTVSTIQSLFLLSLYSHGCGELSRAWVYSGLACAMLMDLGLHRWPIHRIELLHESAERETRTRLIWCVYILDKVLSAEMGRPVILRATDCDAPFLSEVEADELEPWTGSLPKVEGSHTGETTQFIHAPSCLNWGIRLFQIVEKILSSVHAFRRKAQLRHNANAHHILVEIDKELNRWKAALPDWLSFERLVNTRKASEAREKECAEDTSASMPTLADGSKRTTSEGMSRTESRGASGRSRPLPSFFALHLWYFTSTLLLHRPFIPQDEGALLSEVLGSESHKKCTEAADAICDLVERSSTPVDRLSTDLAYCIFTAAVLQLFNARLADEEIAKAAKRRLNLCRQWLKELSETWPAASAHKQLLDGFSIVGAGAMEDVEIQLGIEAAAVAVAADAEAAVIEGGTGGRAAGVENDAFRAAGEETSIQRGPSSGSTSKQAGVGTSPLLLGLPGSGRLLTLNGSSTSPTFNIPVSSVTRSPFFSMNTGRPFPSLQIGGFMLDGGGSALGTAQGPVTAQQRAQLEQYQAYMASFQSRYAIGNGLGSGNLLGRFGFDASASDLSNSTASSVAVGGIAAGRGAGASSSVGTWMVPNTGIASLSTAQAGDNIGSGSRLGNSAPNSIDKLQTGAPSADNSEVARLHAPTSLDISNEIMTPMRMVNADAKAQQGQANISAVSADDFASGTTQTNPLGPVNQSQKEHEDGSSVPMTLSVPLITADAPVGLWDIENFFWNERSAGAMSSTNFNPYAADPGVPNPQTSLNTDLSAQPNVSLDNTGELQRPFIEATARSTPSSVFGIPPPLRTGSSSAIGGDQGHVAASALGPSHQVTNGGLGGPAASFSQLYSQVHARKSSNTGDAQGVPSDFVPVGETKSSESSASSGMPTDGLSMLAEVTAAGSQRARAANSESRSIDAANSASAPDYRPSTGAANYGTPMLGVQPSRRTTPLLGTANASGTPSGTFSTGTPSFGISTGNTPLFNLGMGLGTVGPPSGSSGSTSTTNHALTSANGANTSIISLSPFGFSMTPDPVVWDALALLELPPSFAKV